MVIYEIDRRGGAGGGSKRRSLGQTQILISPISMRKGVNRPNLLNKGFNK